MPGQFALVVRTADGAAKTHQLAAGTYVLGREEDCEVLIESSDVSRHHARLILAAHDFQIVDLGSTLGTKLDGQPLHGPQRAKYPAMLQLGSVNISLEPAGNEAHPPPELDDSSAPVANLEAPILLEFRREIARGGMGSILEADDCKLGRKVAVKIMLSELEADEYQKARFTNEAAVLARLAHPNIVPIYDIGRDAEGQLYYSMKLVKGRTLQAILNGLRDHDDATARHYTLDRLLTVFRKVCDAMAFAHSRGIIHRDLKPENIMVGEFGEVLVMDWGLAKFLEFSRSGGLQPPDSTEAAVTNRRSLDEATNFGMTLEGDVMGTPQYMSPEQAEGKINELDARSDIYSLGGILYTILTLRPPIEGKTLEEVLQKVASGCITPLTQGGATLLSRKGAAKEPQAAKPRSEYRSLLIPPALASVTLKAMSVQRAKRYPEVAALATDIEAYQNGFATSAENAGAWKQLTLFMKRNKAASIGVATVLLLGVTLGTKVVIEGRRATEALASLAKAAPTLIAEGRSLIDAQQFDEALAKISFAVQIEPQNAGYRLLRAQILQAMLRFDEAGVEFRRVLALDPEAAVKNSAQANLTLCEKLLHDYPNADALDAAAWRQLYHQLDSEGRATQAVPIARRLHQGHEATEALLKARLTEWRNIPGWEKMSENNRVQMKDDGTVALNFADTSLEDLAPLKLTALPISRLTIGHTHVHNLAPLKGMPLRELIMYWLSGPIDLSPLRGMPLEGFDADMIEFNDLSPLMGMKLRYFSARTNNLKGLKVLDGMPLEELRLDSDVLTTLDEFAGCAITSLRIRSRVLKDLSATRTMRLTSADFSGCPALRDFTPLLACLGLAKLRVPPNVRQIEVLRSHPKLVTLGYDSAKPQRSAAEFWAEFDALWKAHPGGQQ